MKALATIGLGLFIAWAILSFVAPPNVSTFTMTPWPLELDDSNLALIGAGLESRAPAPPSVMDASPASSAKPVMVMTKAPAPVMMMAPAMSQMMMMKAPTPAPVMMVAPAPAAPVMMMPPAPSTATSSTMTPVSMQAPSPSS